MTAPDTNLPRVWTGTAYVDGPPTVGGAAPVGGVTPQQLTDAIAALSGTYAAVMRAVAVKTTAYTAAGGEIVPADASTAPFTVKLPNTPADKTRVTVKKIDAGANFVTVQCQGSDVFNTAGGGTTVSLALKNQAVTVQYAATGALWLVVGDDMPLSSLTTSLANTFAGVKPGSLVFPPPRAAAPMVVFSFDDNPTNDLTVVKPILDAKGIKGCFCAVTSQVGVTGNMTWDDLRTLRAQGHQIVAHSRTHINLNTADTATQISEITGCYADFVAQGFAPTAYCWPLTANNVANRAIAATSYRYALGQETAVLFNTQPYSSMALARAGIVNGGLLSTYTGWVDTAIATNALLIVLVHSGYNLDTTQQANLSSMIDYIQAHNVQIGTLDQAMAATGNVLEVGDVIGATHYTVIDGSGNLSSSATPPLYLGATNPLVAAVPSSYPVGVSIQTVDAATGATYPDATSGTLETIRPNTSVWYTKQTWRDSSNRVWQRSALGTDAWQGWVEVTGCTTAALNAYSNASLPSAFPVGVTICQINTGLTGTPQSAAGTLITAKMANNGYSYQEWQAFGSSARYRRGQTSGADSWLAWIEDMPVAGILAVTANYTMLTGDQVVSANGTSLTVTLPNPTSTSVMKNRPYIVKNVNSSALTVNSTGAKTIDGAASVSLAQWATLRAMSDGANWLVV